MSKKPKVAFFDFACCEGCQLQVANMGELLLDVLGLIDVVEFREVMSEKWDQSYDIAIIEGSITDKHAEERLKKIRERSNVLIAYGSCATIGGVNGMKNNFKLEDIRKEVYGDRFNYFDSIPTKSVPQTVKVDYIVTGCPVYIPEFVKVLKAALAGIPYYVPDYAVCVECKLNENVCMYDKGVTCFGPVTRAGCNSWCINNGNICYGCRGMVSNPNENGAKDVIAKYKIPMDMVVNKMNMYNKCRENDKSE
ncbi:cytochrome B [candidate division WOR-1 bacterium RIFOXYD2_FULL_36_8]|uniref:Cytochrome B n=1 Tax=candidate division WOR-1 bacterium RIFOXYB2_FULL_36_35 TaxID=1802578 RepID=A0A1F4S8D8_UNCSA|nr:MAG: cytochrome B [candidate division WOR-1 bacterium RIFOXYA2_FULL_36_21]OGC16000.1 MAG: cytochrome B [candidate division WOR-1 bacterium RIFOXYA12_FULL_36_13]OGC16715.1 MAG: cytochrome B [candidate division WOR-1 bacterium RIFOXYB2_FULL_36_35]OGC39346.1 MAG: cytochrome B [candidate division WOR-1 bacterium RIFOXYD2_FULL_36_8]